jgi:hypothetical protein
VVAGACVVPPDGCPASRPERTPLTAASATTTANTMRKPKRRTIRTAAPSEDLAGTSRRG